MHVVPDRPKARSTARLFRWLAAGLAVGVALAIAVEAAQLYRAYAAMSDGRSSLGAASDRLLGGNGLDLQQAELDRVSADLRAAEADFGQAAGILNADPLLRLAGHVPWADRQAEAVVRLADIGRRGAAIGLDSVEALRAAQRVRDSEGGALAEKAVSLLDAVHPYVLSVQAQLSAVTALRSEIDADALVAPLGDTVSALDDRLMAVTQRVQDYEHARSLAPALLGYEGQRTYLVLTQDNTELFASGGLISVYGLLTLDAGRISRLSFTDVGQLLRAWQSGAPAYISPPPPLQRYLLRDWSWNLGTSNWSPDFPTAARQAQFFLETEGGGRVDGVIAINFITVEVLLKALGPLEMPDYGVTLRPENATEVILEQTHNARGEREGKHTFVAKVAGEILDRVLSADASRWGSLLQAFQRLVDQKQLFVYLNEPDLQRHAQALGWAGEVESDAGDYLMLVDTSVHSTKLNLVVEQSIDVTVGLDEGGNAAHLVTVRYHNALPQWAEGKSEALLAQMLGGLYGGYVRLFAPRDSAFQSLLRDGSEAGLQDMGEEAGKAWFGSYLALPAGRQASLTFAYLTPRMTSSRGAAAEYRLVLQKQSGTRAIPVTIRLRLPAGMIASRLVLDGRQLPTDALVLKTDLLTDREVVLTLRRS